VSFGVAETGIRRGEICGLNVGDVDLNEQAITVQRSRWKSKLKRPKNGKKRFFALSPQLTERLRFYVEDRNPEEPLFLSREGRRLHPDNFIKRQLKPILKKLGLDGAAHDWRDHHLVPDGTHYLSAGLRNLEMELRGKAEIETARPQAP